MQRVTNRSGGVLTLLCGHTVTAGPTPGGRARPHFLRCPDCPDEADLPPLPEPVTPPDSTAIRSAIDATEQEATAAATRALGATLFDDYADLPPAAARTRAGDPGTSRAAAVSLGDLRPRQRAVWRLLRRGGGDFATLIDRYARAHEDDPISYPQQSESGLRTRVAELVDYGLVRDSGQRVRLDTGRHAVVWELAPH